MTQDQEQRTSGILYSRDQILAQNLYDMAFNNGGELRGEADGILVVTVTRSRKKRLSMEIFRSSKDLGEVTIRLSRGKERWQDDGSDGLVGWFGELSKVEPERFHPTANQRDEIFRQAGEFFISKQK